MANIINVTQYSCVCTRQQGVKMQYLAYCPRCNVDVCSHCDHCHDGHNIGVPSVKVGACGCKNDKCLLPTACCSITKTGHQAVIQPAWHCNTCNIRMCQYCSIDCHKGHALVSLGQVTIVCQCGINRLKCRGQLPNNRCTFAFTGTSYHWDQFYHCHTCNLVGRLGCCTYCANTCHKGHQLESIGLKPCFCDCGDDISYGGFKVHVNPSSSEADLFFQISTSPQPLGALSSYLQPHASLRNIATDWRYSVQHPVNCNVGGTTVAGSLIGWQLQQGSKKDKTGQLVVHCNNNYLALPAHLVTSRATAVNAPWSSATARCFRLPWATTAFDAISAKQVPGMSLTFRDIFTAINQQGWHVFIVGGAVRDVVQQSPSPLKDIDIAFSCSAEELKMFGEQRGWKFAGITQFGLVKFGNAASGKIVLEGKSIYGPFSDVASQVHYQSIGADLTHDTTCRDFTCNAIYYCPVNKCVIDVTGTGVQDALNRVLRVPVDLSAMTSWINGNPLKVMRYWKMRAAGYKPCTPELDAQFKQEALRVFSSGQIDKSTAQHYVIRGVKRGQRSLKAEQDYQAFKRVLVEHMGMQFWQLYVDV